jgi:hypothetical protein
MVANPMDVEGSVPIINAQFVDPLEVTFVSAHQDQVP